MYTWVVEMLAWPSSSCTARKSCDDCSMCVANEWRSMCGCTGWPSPARFAHAFRRPHTAAGAMRRPRDTRRTADAIEKTRGIASSPAIAVVAAGATLANPGGFIPIALKDISQLNPSAAEYILLWVGFTLVALLPLLAALVSLLVAREWTISVLDAGRGWLERHALTLAAAIIVLLAAALLRNGITGLTG